MVAWSTGSRDSAGSGGTVGPARPARSQNTATLSGRVEFRGFARTSSYQDDFYSYHPPSPSTHRPDPLRAIVYLEGDNLEPAAETPPAVIDQKDEMFVPHILAVQRGTRVDFRNSDALYHNVFSFSKAKRFDLGRYPKGRSRSVIFDRLGVVRVFCEIHSHMSAFILVLPHSYFTTTDGTGYFRIANIPAGRYDLVVWGDPFQPVRRAVEFQSGGNTEIDFVLEAR
ncbi:MAG: carboxypeptidase regulatory-like domain-containing protein [Vicinamibacteria bacterium]